MPKVLYWKGIFSQIDTARYQKQLDALFSGDYQRTQLDMKKKRGHQLWTVRVNDADRLLFTTIDLGGQPYLLLLEEILNHDYQSSRFLNNPGLLDRFRDLSEDVSHDFVAVTTPGFRPLAAPNTAIQSAEGFYYDNTFVIPDENQEAVEHATLPLLVSGPPGSGKSCALISLLQQEAEREHKDIEPGPIYYLTKSPRLVEHMRELWIKMPKQCSDDRVTFLTYETLLRQHGVEEDIVGETHFKDWFKPLRKRLFGADVSDEDIYQELLIASPFDTLSEYQGFGKRHSILAEQREKIFTLLGNYRQHLQTKKQLNLDFYIPADGVLPAVQLIGSDESQDDSPRVLKELYKMARGRVAFFEGSNQELRFKKAIQPFLLGLPGPSTTMSHIELLQAYRCSRAVTQLGNQVLRLKFHLAGTVAHRGQATQIDETRLNNKTTGWVEWLPLKGDAAEARIKAYPYAMTEQAIVAPAQHLDDAQKRFGHVTPLIMTPADIKGLEYKCVIGYRLLERKPFKEASKELNGVTTLQPATTRAKGEAKEKYNTDFNQLFVTVTRAQEGFVFLEEEKEEYRHLIGFLKPDATVTAEVAPQSSEEKTSATTTPENWITEARRQLLAGNTHIAKRIYCEVLGYREALFEKFKNDCLAPKETTAVVRTASVISPVTNPVEELKQEPKSTPVKTKNWVDFVEIIKRNFTVKNLEALFRSDNMEFIGKVLFTRLPGTGEFLLCEVQDDDKKLQIFKTALQNSTTFLAKITREWLLKPVEVKIYNKIFTRAEVLLMKTQKLPRNDKRLLNLFLEAAPALVNHIRIEDFKEKLTFRFAESPGDAGVSYPGYFILVQSGCAPELCTTLLENPEFAKNMTAEELFYAANGFPPVIFFFTCTKLGINNLTKIFLQNETLRREIRNRLSAEDDVFLNFNIDSMRTLIACCDAATEKASGTEKVDKKQVAACAAALLNDFSLKQVKAFLKRDIHFIGRVLFHKDENNALPFLLQVMQTAQTRQTLLRAVDEAPEFLKKIDSEWFETIEFSMKGPRNRLYLLVVWEYNTQGLLAHFLQVCPALASAFNVSNFTRMYPVSISLTASGENSVRSRMSLLFLLAYNKVCHDILRQLLAHNPEFSKGLTVADMLKDHEIHFEKSAVNPFEVLLRNQANDIIKVLLEQNPLLLVGLSTWSQQMAEANVSRSITINIEKGTVFASNSRPDSPNRTSPSTSAIFERLELSSHQHADEDHTESKALSVVTPLISPASLEIDKVSADTSPKLK